MAKKSYYSSRIDKHPTKGKFDFEALCGLFFQIYKQLLNRDYFQEAFGYDCVDAGEVQGVLGNVGLHFYRTLKKANLWPIENNVVNYDESDLFDVIELLHDLVSKPVDGHYHSWNSCGWHYNTFDKSAGQKEFRLEINDILEEYKDGYQLSESGQVILKEDSDSGTQLPVYTPINVTISHFDKQFKYGLPISLQKPRGTVEHDETGQLFRFEENEQVGILRGSIYPNFCMTDLANWIDPHLRLRRYLKPERAFSSDGWKHPSWTAIYNLCQSDVEKTFLQAYICKFVLAYKVLDKTRKKYKLLLDNLKDQVPALIPQVWINWSSTSRDALSRMGYKDSNLPYRLDFVIFWGSRNYVIMIDGIEHYAEKIGNRWDAKEEKYAARLKEDRLLRMQGWNVFRVGNWEVKDASRLEQVLNELRKFVGFEEPPIPEHMEDEIPF